jgi:hypothetical protein
LQTSRKGTRSKSRVSTSAATPDHPARRGLCACLAWLGLQDVGHTVDPVDETRPLWSRRVVPCTLQTLAHCKGPGLNQRPEAGYESRASPHWSDFGSACSPTQLPSPLSQNRDAGELLSRCDAASLTYIRLFGCAQAAASLPKSTRRKRTENSAQISCTIQEAVRLFRAGRVSPISPCLPFRDKLPMRWSSAVSHASALETVSLYAPRAAS